MKKFLKWMVNDELMIGLIVGVVGGLVMVGLFFLLNELV